MDPIPSYPDTNMVEAHLILRTSAGGDEEVHFSRLGLFRGPKQDSRDVNIKK